MWRAHAATLTYSGMLSSSISRVLLFVLEAGTKTILKMETHMTPMTVLKESEQSNTTGCNRITLRLQCEIRKITNQFVVKQLFRS